MRTPRTTTAVKHVAYAILYPLCLLLFGWIEYPVWKEYRNRDHEILQCSVEVINGVLTWQEDPKGTFLIKRLTCYGRKTENFFAWFWKRMFNKIS